MPHPRYPYTSPAYHTGDPHTPRMRRGRQRVVLSSRSTQTYEHRGRGGGIRNQRIRFFSRLIRVPCVTSNKKQPEKTREAHLAPQASQQEN